MKALVVRIDKGDIYVDGKVVSSVGKGLALFVGIEKGDNPESLEKMARKVANLRVFEDEEGKLNFSVRDKGYEILCISNFTLCANTDKGRRPKVKIASDLQRYISPVKLNFLGDFLGTEIIIAHHAFHKDIRIDKSSDSEPTTIAIFGNIL